MFSGKIQDVFVSVRLFVLFLSVLSLSLIGYYRVELYVKNMIIHESTMQDIDEAWFDMSLCFGPKYSLETVSLYLKANEYRIKYPDTWKEKVAASDHRTILNVENNYAIGSIEQYRDFYINRFNWTADSMYDIGNHVNMESLGIGWYRHIFPTNETKFKADFNFLSFRYSWCFNYTYTDLFASHESVDGVKGRNVEDPFHEVGMQNHQYNWYFDRNKISEYIDVYVYPKGHEFEYPLIEDHVPFRIDMADWQRLRASATKVVRQNRASFNCIDPEQLGGNTTYIYNLCMTWCLRRTVLNHIKCTIPELDHYIYNFTKIIGAYMDTPPERRAPFRGSFYFNSDSAWPWMQEYQYLKPCDSAQSFEETFDAFEKTFFPRGDKFAMNPSCATECPPDCTEYRGMLATEGTELHASTAKMHGVTVYHSARIEEIRENWKYTIQQLLIDVSGVMSFLLGLSLIAIHEWCFILTKWLVQHRGSSKAAPELSYLRDDMRYDDYHEYEDDYRDYEQSSGRLYPGDFDSYYDDYGDDRYDRHGEYGDQYEDYGDESVDYAGDEMVLDAAPSALLYAQDSPSISPELRTKSSHLAP